MRISHDVRDYANENGLQTQDDIDAAIQKGMEEKSAEFADHGNRVYLPIST